MSTPFTPDSSDATKTATSFASRVLDFVDALVPPQLTSAPVEWLLPHRDPEARRCMADFYRRFYDDDHERLFVFGVNPGRFGAGVTGIPFTDPYALSNACGIQHTLGDRQELSATFIHDVIAELGGCVSFFRHVYITSVCPLGLLLDGKNRNYYDDRRVLAELDSFIVDSIQRQITFGARRDVAIVIGSGANARVMDRLNAEHRWFAELRMLDHPRFIMQYRRAHLPEYRASYAATFSSLLGRESTT